MKRASSGAILFLSLLATSACTQPPAQVDLKGHYVFSKNGPEQGNVPAVAYAPQRFSTPAYAQSSRISQPAVANQSYAAGPTQQTARVSSIGVSDLAPPQKDSVWASQTAPASDPQLVWKEGQPAQEIKASAEQWRADTKEVAIQTVKEPTINKAKGSKVNLITQPKQSDFIWPVNGQKILSSYGPKGSGKANDGINIAASEGEPVWAVADGEVIFVGDQLSGYGNMVLIKHPGNNTTTYAHLNQATVDKYDRVKQGDIIGYVGSTGNVKSSQLYFAVREGKEHVDPKKYLLSNVAGL